MPTLGVTGRCAKSSDEEEVVESLGGHWVDGVQCSLSVSLSLSLTREIRVGDARYRE